jgi:hypothetical protein
MEEWVADACAVVAVAIEVAVRGADLDGAVEVGPSWSANACVVDALTSGQAVIGASGD